jgi:MoaA/NifB/PqqE/SkfB family radical SAM enzyme
MEKRNIVENNNITYGFHGRLKPEFPSQIIVDITEVCNLSCIHCPHVEFRKSEHYKARYLEPELNAKMVDEIREHGNGVIKYIRYTSNGESLIHPQGYEMIEYAAGHSGVYVTLTTNGTIMNEKRTQKILDSGIYMIDISIDAFKPETYAKIRINGDLNITRTNVLRLLKLARNSGSKTKVVVSFVEQPLNREETVDFKTFWKDNGADYVIIRRLHSHAGAKSDLLSSRQEKNKNKTRHPCLYPWERIVLNADGKLAFCPCDWIHGSVITDYRTASIRETWNGKFYQQLREAHSTNNFEKHKFCKQCPDWETTRWPWEGRSYADMIEEFIKDQ